LRLTGSTVLKVRKLRYKGGSQDKLIVCKKGG